MHPERRPNLDRSPEALEARLRALPQPPVPADLEAQLLAAIPNRTALPSRPDGSGEPSYMRRWSVWAGVVGALAAACLLAVLAWPRRDGKSPDPSPAPGESGHQVTPRPADDPPGITAWREARRILDGAEMPAFHWPLEETTPLTVSTSIPSDLLD
jgi:hypothetical protein